MVEQLVTSGALTLLKRRDRRDLGQGICGSPPHTLISPSLLVNELHVGKESLLSVCLPCLGLSQHQ